jgi:hypothetical protein
VLLLDFQVPMIIIISASSRFIGKWSEKAKNIEISRGVLCGEVRPERGSLIVCLFQGPHGMGRAGSLLPLLCIIGSSTPINQ